MEVKYRAYLARIKASSLDLLAQLEEDLDLVIGTDSLTAAERTWFLALKKAISSVNKKRELPYYSKCDSSAQIIGRFGVLDVKNALVDDVKNLHEYQSMLKSCSIDSVAIKTFDELVNNVLGQILFLYLGLFDELLHGGHGTAVSGTQIKKIIQATIDWCNEICQRQPAFRSHSSAGSTAESLGINTDWGCDGINDNLASQGQQNWMVRDGVIDPNSTSTKQFVHNWPNENKSLQNKALNELSNRLVSASTKLSHSIADMQSVLTAIEGTFADWRRAKPNGGRSILHRRVSNASPNNVTEESSRNSTGLARVRNGLGARLAAAVCLRSKL